MHRARLHLDLTEAAVDAEQAKKGCDFSLNILSTRNDTVLEHSVIANVVSGMQVSKLRGFKILAPITVRFWREALTSLSV